MSVIASILALKKKGWGLRTRLYFVLWFLALMILMVVALSIYREYRLVTEDWERERRDLAGAFAITFIHILDKEPGRAIDRKALDSYIGDIMENQDRSIEYIVVTDTSGEVLGYGCNSGFEGFAKTYHGKRLTESAATDKVPRRRGEDEEGILEVFKRLVSGSDELGALTIGYSKHGLQTRLVKRHLVKPYNKMILLAVGFILFTSIVVYVLILKMIHPILELANDLREVGKGNLSIRSTIGHKDEIGFLSQAFNFMMDNLNRAREELESTRSHMIQTEKMAAMGKLSAGLAHEINNPLGGVLTCIETLKQDSRDEELRTRYLELIHTGMQRIKRTVKQLLNFAEQRSFYPEPTNINVLVNRTIEMTFHHFSSNKISLHKNFDESLSEILADPHQLIQVFVNLILNAVQAMPEEGELSIKTSHEDGRVKIAIKDTGCGIPEENLDRIFDPFFSTKGPGQGTGLGLSVSYGIIQSHGGEIEVESQEYIGSEFTIILPGNHQR